MGILCARGVTCIISLACCTVCSVKLGGSIMDIRFTNRWGGFSMEELERILWMTEYYVNQDDLTFDLGEEIRNEIRRRDLWDY